MLGFERLGDEPGVRVSSVGSSNPRLKVLIGPLEPRRSMATMELESIPPDSDTPTGTSEINWRWTAA